MEYFWEAFVIAALPLYFWVYAIMFSPNVKLTSLSGGNKVYPMFAIWILAATLGVNELLETIY